MCKQSQLDCLTFFFNFSELGIRIVYSAIASLTFPFKFRHFFLTKETGIIPWKEKLGWFYCQAQPISSPSWLRLAFFPAFPHPAGHPASHPPGKVLPSLLECCNLAISLLGIIPVLCWALALFSAFLPHPAIRNPTGKVLPSLAECFC